MLLHLQHERGTTEGEYSDDTPSIYIFQHIVENSHSKSVINVKQVLEKKNEKYLKRSFYSLQKSNNNAKRYR